MREYSERKVARRAERKPTINRENLRHGELKENREKLGKRWKFKENLGNSGKLRKFRKSVRTG